MKEEIYSELSFSTHRDNTIYSKVKGRILFEGIKYNEYDFLFLKEEADYYYDWWNFCLVDINKKIAFYNSNLNWYITLEQFGESHLENTDYSYLANLDISSIIKDSEEYSISDIIRKEYKVKIYVP